MQINHCSEFCTLFALCVCRFAFVFVTEVEKHEGNALCTCIPLCRIGLTCFHFNEELLTDVICRNTQQLPYLDAELVL